MKQQTLSLFDLDHTLLPIDSDQQWGKFLAKVGAVNAIEHTRKNEQYYQQYKAGTLDIDEFLCFCLNPLSQYERHELTVWQNQYVNEIIVPNITSNAIKLVERMKKTGICLLVTATNSFVAMPVARLLGFEDHELIATEPNTIDNCEWYKTENKFNGKVLGIPNFQKNKVTKIQEWLQKNNYTKEDFSFITAFSDSHNDIPMLEWADLAVATNADDILLAHAQQNAWPVLSLF